MVDCPISLLSGFRFCLWEVRGPFTFCHTTVGSGPGEMLRVCSLRGQTSTSHTSGAGVKMTSVSPLHVDLRFVNFQRCEPVFPRPSRKLVHMSGVHALAFSISGCAFGYGTVLHTVQ